MCCICFCECIPTLPLAFTLLSLNGCFDYHILTLIIRNEIQILNIYITLICLGMRLKKYKYFIKFCIQLLNSYS